MILFRFRQIIDLKIIITQQYFLKMSEYSHVSISKLTPDYIGQKIYFDVRIHNIRNTKTLCFVIGRTQLYTIQMIAVKKTLGSDFDILIKTTKESVIKVYGILNKVPESVSKISGTYYKDFELILDKFETVSIASKLPFELEDAESNKEDYRSDVQLSTKLDNRFLDLRTKSNYCIYKIKSGISKFFREYLDNGDFMEINTPKIVGGASEGGANVFELKYFDKKGYLAQSPQLYKQMAINADFERVYEIGPVFRAENSVSHRHLCEFTGLDVEMTISPAKDYTEVIELLWNVLTYIFTNLHIKYDKEIAYIKEKFPYEEIKYPVKPLIIDFKDGVQMLIDAGINQKHNEDLNTENERLLGNIVKEKYGSDLFVLNKYPLCVRPFYTMPIKLEKDDSIQYSNSFDVIMRCEEICSGAQRINNYEELIEQITNRDINIGGLEDYIHSFTLGSKPHAGFGCGLERCVMLFLDLHNVRKTSMFPRDPKRITP